LEEYLPIRMRLPHFSNARSVRNGLDRARLRQANRLFASRSRVLTKADLVTIEESDIRGSRVFAEGKLEGEPETKMR
ncbi:CbbX protein, partial [Mesorhizobium sp. M7A.F.Ca.CA.004.04.2.1]